MRVAIARRCQLVTTWSLRAVAALRYYPESRMDHREMQKLVKESVLPVFRYFAVMWGKYTELN